MNTAGISINGKHSFTDLGQYLKSRNIGIPSRKRVTGTVPYMNGYYDFSALNGEPAYDERTLEYTFDIMEDTPEAVEMTKNNIISWAMGAVESKIYDDYDPDHYFIGSYSEAEFTEDDDLPEEGGELTITFAAQPYRYDRETDEGVI